MVRLVPTLSLIGATAVLVLAAASARAEMLTSDAGLKPGLAVCYTKAMVRHVDEVFSKEDDCEPGPPLKKLNYKTGRGKVLTSPWTDGVLAKITGYIHLDQPGEYAFVFESNDGVRLRINGMMVTQDPDVHKDRFSDVGIFRVKEPGWYPVSIRYFERRSTSTLKLFWQPPGDTSDTMPLVPAEVLAHK